MRLRTMGALEVVEAGDPRPVTGRPAALLTSLALHGPRLRLRERALALHDWLAAQGQRTRSIRLLERARGTLASFDLPASPDLDRLADYLARCPATGDDGPRRGRRPADTRVTRR